GKDASMPFGAVRLALKYGSALLPSFYTRVKGPYIKTIITPPFEIKRSGDPQRDIHDNLQDVVRLFEKYIRRYPKEYLWTYKAWKYSKEAGILILSDGKTGHLRQAQAAAKMLSSCLAERQIRADIETAPVKFRNRFTKSLLGVSGCLAGKYSCQGCLACLRKALVGENYDYLIRKKPDYIISCGSALAPVNFLLSRENLAKSICVMRPGLLSAGKFNLVLMPRHDCPPRRGNIVVTDGALNLIDGDYLEKEAQRLSQSCKVIPRLRSGQAKSQVYLGFLIGGDTKKFCLNVDIVREAARQVKLAAEKLNAHILVTTSRRTSKETEAMVKRELQDCPRCKLLVIANEKNIPEAVGGILGLSSIVVTSPESISMISEAVAAKKHVLVFREKGLDKKHARFLELFSRKKYITLAEGPCLERAIEDIFRSEPRIPALADNFAVREALKRLI
ncbi:MAG: ELM1/GtrOC1 family putative glycosyltransferase, partial [Candidatus Omnitrophota bacterium]|nr:ELM1/GtrOC1 family putative glycosyltransferase [Candidatus Omnitrophota bacterium]